MSTVERFIVVDLLTGDIGTNEAYGGALGSARAKLEGHPRFVFVQLSDLDVVPVNLDTLTPERLALLPRPEDAIIRLPVPSEIEYEPATGWFVPNPRPSFEESQGKTKAELTAGMVERGVAQNLAQTTVAALEGEYDAYDPLEGVHPHGTSIEDIAQAGIVAMERRAARKAG